MTKLTRDVKFLIRTARAAAKMVTPNFVTTAKDDKGDLITNLDTAIERFIVERIKRAYPAFDVLGEEFTPEAKLGPDNFIIDPIDGTINFANGLPIWAVQIAMARAGETCASVIYFPVLRECFYADPSGAYLNGRRIHASGAAFEKSLFACNDLFKSNPIADDLNRTGGVKMFGKAIDPKILFRNKREFYCASAYYSWVACGRMGTVAFGSPIYDHAAGQYICKMAGAYTYHNKETKLGVATTDKRVMSVLESK